MEKTLGQVSTEVKIATLELFHGDREAAEKWLSSPCKALGNITPIEMINQSKSNHAVLNVIARIEHGVFQ